MLLLNLSLVVFSEDCHFAGSINDCVVERERNGREMVNANASTHTCRHTSKKIEEFKLT